MTPAASPASPDIKGFHAHIYFDAETQPTAQRVRDALEASFDVPVSVLFDGPLGPHTKAMFQVNLTREHFGTIVPWLMLNRGGLSVLVHPSTDDDIADHDTRPLWMGEPLPVDLDFLRRFLGVAQGVAQKEEVSS